MLITSNIKAVVSVIRCGSKKTFTKLSAGFLIVIMKTTLVFNNFGLIKDDVDYTSLGEALGIEIVTISSILQPPGNTITMHRDTFFKINNMYPEDTRQKVRANIYLEDWAPGHFINYQDSNKEWQTSTHWNAGDGFIWNSDHLHLSANAGLTPKYTLQISGFWTK